MRTCTYHCRGYPFGGCDSHFSSLRAFDLHRQGPHDGERVCVEPADVSGLELLTAEGRCDHQRPRPDGPIAIWTLAGWQERSEQLSAAHGSR